MARAAVRQQLSFGDMELVDKAPLDPRLQRISGFLDRAADLLEAVRHDLLAGLAQPARGRQGLTAEQVLRSFILQRIQNLPLRDLRDRIDDGLRLRQFTRFFWDQVPRHDAFQRAFAKISTTTMARINDTVIRLAVELELEDGQWTRGDTTVVETDIHYPTDSSLLWDAVRVLTRLVLRLRKIVPEATRSFANRTRRAKRRAHEIQRRANSRRQQPPAYLYRDLIRLTEEVLHSAREVLPRARARQDLPLVQWALVHQLCQEIELFCRRAEQVLAQARRRVLGGETVPVAEKIVSIFEPHTDIIVRGKPLVPAEFGHKIFLAETPAGLIYHCQVLDGNPSDDSHLAHWLERHVEIFGGPPQLLAADRGFHSADNLKLIETCRVGFECLPERGGRRSAERAAYERSPRFRKGQRFRAGIEGRISVLDRGRGMKRCRLSGRDRFEFFVAAAVLANNLLALARLLAAKNRSPRRAAA